MIRETHEVNIFMQTQDDPRSKSGSTIEWKEKQEIKRTLTFRRFMILSTLKKVDPHFPRVRCGGNRDESYYISIH